MAQKMGGLFVTVDADTKKALANIRQVSAAAKLASQNFDKLKKSAGNAGGSNMARGLDKVKQSSDKAGKSTKKTGDEFDKMGKKAQVAGKPLANLQASMYRLSQSFINLRYGNPLGVFAGLTQSFTSLSRAAKGIGIPGIVAGIAGISAAAVIAASSVTLLAGAFAKFGLKEAANLEMLRIQYEGLLGSAQRGKAEVDYILNLGKESVVPTEGLLEANRLLLAYGVTVDETRQSLVKFFSDFGSATGLSSARLQDMAYALGQVEAQGRANAIDLRQLANAGLNLALVYEKVAEQQNISAQEAKALTSEGKMTADILIPAVVALGDNYEAAAAKARDSVQGILANLKDIAKINIATAFEGLLQQLKPLLKWVEVFMESFDFGPIAEAISNFVSYVSEAMSGLSLDAGDTAETVVKFTADLINTVGFSVAKTIQVVRAMIASIEVAINALWVGMVALFRDVMNAAAQVIEFASYIPGPWQSSMEQASAAVNDFAIKTQTYAQGAANSMVAAANSAGSAWNSIFTQVKFMNTKPLRGSGSSVGELPAIPKPSAPPAVDPGGKGKDEANELEKALESLTKIWQKFKSLAAKPLGSASQIEKALAFNPDTFQGSTSQIVSMYGQMRDATADYFNLLISEAPKAQRAALKSQKSAVLGGLEREFQRLYDLAERNEELKKELAEWKKTETERLQGEIKKLTATYEAEVKTTEAYYDKKIEAAQSALDKATEAYENANSKLQSLISERDNYLNGIRDSAFSFVNSLTETNEAIAKVTELDEVGSFSSVSGEATVDFKAQLQERLDAVKQWRADIETLLARGLDRNLMDALISAGPDNGGALASALANETDAGIAEINSIQAELTGAVSGLQSSVSAAFFDQGIAQQQAFTNQMAANVASAQAYLDKQQALRDQALEQLRANYDKRKAELEAQIAAVEAAEDAHSVELLKMMEANAKTAEEIAKKIQKTTADLSNKNKENNLFDLGEKAIKGLINGMNSQRKAAIDTARSIANAIKAEMKGAFQIQSPSKVMMGYGENISEGLAIGMENGISKVDMAAARVANAAMISGEISSGAPTVKVFIGDQELKDIVDVQITDASGRDFDVAFAGRRDF